MCVSIYIACMLSSIFLLQSEHNLHVSTVPSTRSLDHPTIHQATKPNIPPGLAKKPPRPSRRRNPPSEQNKTKQNKNPPCLFARPAIKNQKPKAKNKSQKPKTKHINPRPFTPAPAPSPPRRRSSVRAASQSHGGGRRRGRTRRRGPGVRTLCADLIPFSISHRRAWEALTQEVSRVPEGRGE